MTEHEASRTLVKSTPELWAECSDAASLARHLGAFGEIRITKLAPETAVAWEGEDVRGTVTLEPSGWGTRVILTAVAQPGDEPVDSAPAAEPPPEVAPPEVVPPEVVPPAVADPPEPATEAPTEAPEPGPSEVPADPAPHEPAEVMRPGFLRRLFGGRRRATPAIEERPERAPAVAPEASAWAPEEPEEPAEHGEEHAEAVAAVSPPQPAPAQPEVTDPAAAALAEALDSLGRAHHRPYSRG